ncbi:AsnC family transcriptional regulator [Gorillibacterium massiliense]|uniref:siroheme decarboxylase subunit beta n=1 Tax=Gorillibacterium massiliense TaxID=1280390 RepID=UPI0004B83351|nr:AsnC family transcriptional regulator [Gorillibacterium massiliense]
MRIEELDKKLLRIIQGDFPLCPDPYEAVAKQAGCTKAEVLKRLKRLKDSGAVKRIGAVLRHRQAGFGANGMLVCSIPLSHLEEAGKRLATLPQVSHCYQRSSAPDWPYNLYAMIHGTNEREVAEVVMPFIRSQRLRSDDFDILFSTEELKKTSFQI